VIRAFAGATGVPVETRDISLAGGSSHDSPTGCRMVKVPDSLAG
jgi:hypothetical protein